MAALRLILGDQLNEQISSLSDCDKQNDVVLIAEVREEATYVKHHKKKIVLLFSAMRHFANQLRDANFNVAYRYYDDEDNQGSLLNEVKLALQRHNLQHVVVTFPGEYRLLKSMQQWEQVLGVSVEIRPDDRFISTPEQFSKWADGRKQWRMEYFYRDMRRQTGLLMEGDQPIGGKWNFDHDNRKSMPSDVQPPKPYTVEPDETTQTVMKLVENTFPDHMGSATDFSYAVTRSQALEVAKQFIDQRLPNFGDYQDAMREGDVWLFHSHLSFYLNSGLLLPLEVMQMAEQAYFDNAAPLNAVEGFIRQILGWREYVRGFYWHCMPTLQHDNYFEHTRALPEFFWTAHTNMNCMRQCISDTKQHAYAHHIQRLMVIGNFSLLAGLDPVAVNEWYLLVYADAYEWVEMPNVSGMILFADGGKLASKPYVASGQYINRMSDYCKNCGYSVSKKTGPKACPFNYLYWDFLIKHQDKLAKNPRMALIYKSLGRMSEDNIAAMQEQAQALLSKLDSA
ncbi:MULTISPECIES: cryptochrome/photolyase family protein [Marisediminitalea]|jgi:deoxyribodipyrimidine photolyase-related protein|uniref:cryptochrome/photolyase family protein n=1 Tax=Marisediminitalea TaxID=2662254 RepID=UPI000C4FFD94|nr:cryptochrome/photolyase family protein [Marisediminitalea aggregata]MBL52914.1 cryptochrome/photolyase family protein [Alteromonadaceae bacterium]MCP3862822.1 cryptochrome/photolyase family protein [Aestuariibacter sp.]MCP4866301.1 cryptochrome/photolyase family protein [Alteromonas sp.]MCP4237875.1 cryptochrome/photolyase family protein [Aestuariibacter sp.]MCP4526579.1 cryptochrome/photolyase family protein [Aestuariibacter sp.]|tara:strand:+ start:2280 stop:3809 length:1530 start_codon:yes stop_codon:yes gene_type:complete